MITLENFLRIENDPEITRFCWDNPRIPLWQYVRFSVLLNAINQATGLKNAHAPAGKLSRKELLAYFRQSLKHSPFRKKRNQARVILFSTAMADSVLIDGKYFNRLHDYYGLVSPDTTLIIEDSYRKKYRLPRFYPNLAFTDIIRLKAKIRSMFSSRRAEDAKTIEDFLTYIRPFFAESISEDFINGIRNNLTQYNKVFRHQYHYYLALFKKLQPRIIFLNCASYGNDLSLIAAAKELNIPVGEFQHGLISAHHPAYNYGQAIFANEEYRKVLPDYFLTFGDFWNESIRIPAEKVIIGNPHFQAQKEKYGLSSGGSKTTKILIASDGTLPDEFTRFTQDLSRLAEGKDMEIIFRLHPGEVPFLKERYSSLQGLKNVTINTEGDIYEWIAQCDTVVTTYSTIIYEALGFHKKVYVYEHVISRMNIPVKVAPRFSDAGQLLDLIMSGKDSVPQSTDIYWNPNWKQNYRDFTSRFSS